MNAPDAKIYDVVILTAALADGTTGQKIPEGTEGTVVEVYDGGVEIDFEEYAATVTAVTGQYLPA